MSALNELSAIDSMAQYRHRGLSPVDVLQAVLARIAQCEPQIRATYALDAEGALAMAGESEARLAQGRPLGALDGVPVTIKEAIATKGVPVQSWVLPGMIEGLGRFLSTRVRVDMAAMSPERRALMLPAVRRAAEGTAGLTADEVYQAYAQILALRAATVSATVGVDYVLSPVSATLPYAAEWTGSDPEASQPLKDVFYTLPYNISEQPAASINCGYSENGLPIGLQIVGRRFERLGRAADGARLGADAARSTSVAAARRRWMRRSLCGAGLGRRRAPNGGQRHTGSPAVSTSAACASPRAVPSAPAVDPASGRRGAPPSAH